MYISLDQYEFSKWHEELSVKDSLTSTAELMLPHHNIMLYRIFSFIYHTIVLSFTMFIMSSIFSASS